MSKRNQYFLENKELHTAISVIWKIVSTLIIFILCLSFFGDEGDVLKMAPTCAAKNSGQSCFLCGSTQAFLASGNLDYKMAVSHNSNSVILFVLFFINSIFFIINTYKSIKIKFYT